MKKFISIICLLIFTILCIPQNGNAAPPSLPWGTKKLLGATSAETTAQTREDVYLSPASIPSIMAAPGTVSELKLDHNVETLNAAKTVLITDKPIQWYDCNGTDRNVTMPAEATNSTDLVFTFYNDSDGADEDLVLKDDTPTTLITIGPGQGAEVSCDGTSWKVLGNNGIKRDSVAGHTIIDDFRDFKKHDMTNGDTQTALSEANMKAHKYVSNQGETVEVDIILVAVSYPVQVIFSVEEALIMEIAPPAGELFDLDGTALDANDCVDSPAVVGSKLAATRLQIADGSWRWSLDTIRGAWIDTGVTD